jgi:hypothetical protein
MPQRRLWSANRVVVLCDIPWEECLLWECWHLKKTCSNHIMTSHQLYEWAQSSIHNLNFDFVTEN